MNVAVNIKKGHAKEALAASAFELFNKQGYKVTTISEIAEHAGYHVQTFYRHFASKEDLLAEIWRQSYLKFKAKFDARGKTRAIEAWRNYIKDQAESVIEESQPWGLEDTSSIPVLTSECQIYQDQYRKLLAEGIAQDMNVNAQNDIRPMLIACTLFDGNSMAARQWIGKPINKKGYISSLVKVVDETEKMLKNQN